MKQNRKVLGLIGFVAVLVMFSHRSFADIPTKPNPPRLVNDFANIIPDADEAKLEARLVDYDNKTSIQITVVTVESLNDQPVSDAAPEIGQKWGVGQKGMDNGIVILVSMGNPKGAFIATGYGIESEIPDAVCKRIFEQEMKPLFKQGYYTQGISDAIDKITEILQPISWSQRIELKRQQAAKERMQRLEMIDSLTWLAGFLVGIAAIFFSGLWVYRKNKRVRNEVLRMKKHYQNILDDEVVVSENWPKWALELVAENNRNKLSYAGCKEACQRQLKRLPNWLLTRIFTNEKKFEEVQSYLDIFDDVDRTLTKIRNDVRLYDERAPRALQETKELLKEVSAEAGIGTTDTKAQGFNFEKEKTLIGQVARSIENFQITDRDSYRTCFLGALACAEQLQAALGTITAEKQAKIQFEKHQEYFSDKISTFPSLITTYQNALTGLGAYAATASVGLPTHELFKNSLTHIKSQVTNATAKSQSQIAGAFQDALVRIQSTKEETEALFATVQNAQDRIVSQEQCKARFAEDKKHATAAVVEAEKSIVDSDVEQSTRDLAKEARQILETAIRLAAANRVDWVLVSKKLADAESKARNASKLAYNDKKEASVKRSSNRTYYSSTRTSSVSTSTTTSSSGGGGGFGGFGGGSFGGGGGGGSW